MPQSLPPPLDPKIAELLRTTDFGNPPVGAKGCVREQLELAGIVSNVRPAGAGSATTPRATEPAPHAQVSPWRSAVDAIRIAIAKVPAKPALTVLAAIALGAAGALHSAGLASRSTDRGSAIETPRSIPNALPGAAANQEPAALPPASSVPNVRPAPPPIKRPSATESLGYERQLLAHARAQLVRGELETATRELDRHAQLFPNGMLTEEREALRIVTLAQQGNLTAARERAARFRRSYPRSIQMSTIDSAVAERP